MLAHKNGNRKKQCHIFFILFLICLKLDTKNLNKIRRIAIKQNKNV